MRARELKQLPGERKRRNVPSRPLRARELKLMPKAPAVAGPSRAPCGRVN